jgi:hypothetical protein
VTGSAHSIDPDDLIISIEPEPTPDERAAIVAALAALQEAAGSDRKAGELARWKMTGRMEQLRGGQTVGWRRELMRWVKRR